MSNQSVVFCKHICSVWELSRVTQPSHITLISHLVQVITHIREAFLLDGHLLGNVGCILSEGLRKTSVWGSPEFIWEGERLRFLSLGSPKPVWLQGIEGLVLEGAGLIGWLEGREGRSWNQGSSQGGGGTTRPRWEGRGTGELASWDLVVPKGTLKS